MPETKRCSRCGEDKPATAEHFSPSRQARDGLYYYCRDCKREYARAYQAGSLRRPKVRSRALAPGLGLCELCSVLIDQADGGVIDVRRDADGNWLGQTRRHARCPEPFEIHAEPRRSLVRVGRAATTRRPPG